MLREKILNLMEEKDYKPQVVDEIYQKLNLSTSEEFVTLVKTLNTLADEYIVTYDAKGRFALLNTFNLATGTLDIKDGGFGFVDTEFGGIFVGRDNLNGAISFDEVMVRYYIDKKGRFEGEITKVIKRNITEIIGNLELFKGKHVVRSNNPKIQLLVFIKSSDLNKAKIDDIVKVKIDKYYPNLTADGKVIEVYGNKNLPGLDITSLVLTSGVPVDFSKETLIEIKNIPSKIDADYELKQNKNLRDLRDYQIITIDSFDAKDLDDAIRVEKLDNGNYLLGVYIANVTHYVKDSSPLDKDALERGTSVYLPDRVIPMLPKALSNGICSLNEGADRLVMACEMEINSDGEVVKYDIFEGIIRSLHKMTYENVNKMLEEQNKDIIKEYIDIYPMLKDAEHLAKILYQMRIKRGAFEFESLESKLILNEKGKVEKITLRVQKTAENLIEEFMLIANETVAQAMTWLDVPFIYRVHEEPKEEKLTKLLMTLDQFGYTVKIKNKKALPKLLQQVLLDLNDADPDDEETVIKNAIINRVMIRSMAKAVYQEYNIGHFGLASECYTHFTSPIRRYPDLLVHRLIKEFMLGISQTDANNKISYFSSIVNYAGINSSKTEKRAEVLERDATEFKKVEYIKDYVGKTFTGIISSITQFGMYIMLDNTIEGLVKYNSMTDDYYEIDEIKGQVKGERSKKIYQIGSKVRVRLLEASLAKRTVTFKLLGKE